MNNLSFKFHEIFPTYETFIDAVSRGTNLPFTGEDGLNHSDNYIYLFNRYATCEVAYETKEAFIRHFLGTYMKHYGIYAYKRKLVYITYKFDPNKLGDKSLLFDASSFNNSTILTDPLDKVNPYVDAQVAHKEKGNEFFATIQAINEAISPLIMEFVDLFNVHFIRLIPNYEYYYNKE